MNIIVIGGSGFIGTRLVDRLDNAGHNVTIIDKKVSESYPEKTSIADIRNYETLRRTMSNAFSGGIAEVVFNLAAEHRDDVHPKSLYEEVNVGGTRNICRACSSLGIDRQIFTSTVAVYGFTSPDTGEEGTINPFNEYGRTKAEAEVVYSEWLNGGKDRLLTIVRPTVVFGERNRGNIYNLIRQMAVGPFLMVGKGENQKSVAYVENVAAFLEYSLKFSKGKHVYNYVDKPDYSMNDLVCLIDNLLERKPGRGFRLPYPVGYAGGFILDILARITNRSFPVSAIRVKKFCSDTMFATKVGQLSDFSPPVSLEEAWERTVRYEFIEDHKGEKLFFTE